MTEGKVKSARSWLWGCNLCIQTVLNPLRMTLNKGSLNLPKSLLKYNILNVTTDKKIFQLINIFAQ